MSDAKEKVAGAVKHATPGAKRKNGPTSYRTILMAASVGVLIGLIIKR
jgi:hypothetical protein